MHYFCGTPRLSNAKALLLVAISCCKLLEARCAGQTALPYSSIPTDKTDVETTEHSMLETEFSVTTEISTGSGQDSESSDYATSVASTANASEKLRHARMAADEVMSTFASTIAPGVETKTSNVSGQENFQTTAATTTEETLVVNNVFTTENAFHTTIGPEAATTSLSSTLAASNTDVPSQITAHTSTDIKTAGSANAAGTATLAATTAAIDAVQAVKISSSTAPAVHRDDDQVETITTNTVVSHDKKIGHGTGDIRHSSTRTNPAVVIGVAWASTVAVAIVVVGLIRRQRSVRSVTLAFPSDEHRSRKFLRKTYHNPEAAKPSELGSIKDQGRQDIATVEMLQCDPSVVRVEVKQCHSEVSAIDEDQRIPEHSAADKNPCLPDASTADFGAKQCGPKVLTVDMDQRPPDNVVVDVKQCDAEASKDDKDQCPPKTAPIDGKHCYTESEAVNMKQCHTETATVDVEQCLLEVVTVDMEHGKAELSVA